MPNSDKIRQIKPFFELNPSRFAGNMLTLRDAAAEAGISLRSLNRMRARGYGPLVTELDGKRLVARHNLERWLARHTQPTPGDCPPAYRGSDRETA